MNGLVSAKATDLVKKWTFRNMPPASERLFKIHSELLTMEVYRGSGEGRESAWTVSALKSTTKASTDHSTGPDAGLRPWRGHGVSKMDCHMGPARWQKKCSTASRWRANGRDTSCLIKGLCPKETRLMTVSYYAILHRLITRFRSFIAHHLISATTSWRGD